MQQAIRGNIRPFEVMEALREANEVEKTGKDVIHLSLGQPGHMAPQEVLDHVAEKIKSTSLGYTDSRGMLQLRERISQHYADTYGLDISVDRIFVTVGSSSAYALTLKAAFEAGDKIAIARPCYPAYPRIMQASDIETVYLEADESTNFQPNLEMLKPHANEVKGLVIASPSNPTGSVITKDIIEELAEECSKRYIRIISDEIYHGVTYGVAPTSILSCPGDHITVNSFSKYYLLPGWRLGWAVVPENLNRSYESLLQNFFISPPAISQVAGLEVFNHLNKLDAVVKEYRHNRDILAQGLRDAGITHFREAEGAFYLYANIATFSDDSKKFCRKMLHEAGVCAVPGNDFDEINGHHYVRFSFAGNKEEIERAVARIKAWLQGS